jgi:site-specific recombinase XerD
MLLFTEALGMFRKHQITIERSPQTIRGYKEDLTLFSRHLQQKYNCPAYLVDIRKEDVEEYLLYLKEERGYQPASRKRILGSIRSFFNYAYKSEWCEKNIAATMEPIKCQQKERHYLLEEEVDQLIEAIEHQLVRLVVQTLYFTGMRISECLNLKMEDVDLEANIIHVIAGKGNKDRNIPINPKLLELLTDYKQNWRVDSSRFFATRISGTLSVTSVARVLREATEALGWKKKVTAHTIRHSFASKLVKNNVHLVKISKLLGHSSLKTTSIYAHSSMEDLKEAVNSL